jgi:hypothetical protein
LKKSAAFMQRSFFLPLLDNANLDFPSCALMRVRPFQEGMRIFELANSSTRTLSCTRARGNCGWYELKRQTRRRALTVEIGSNEKLKVLKRRLGYWRALTLLHRPDSGEAAAPVRRAGRPDQKCGVVNKLNLSPLIALRTQLRHVFKPHAVT